MHSRPVTGAGLPRVLVLGHNGFIGRRVMDALARLEADGHCPHARKGLSYPELDLANAESARQLDTHLDPGTVVIFLSGIKRQLGDDAGIFRRNVEMVLNAADAFARQPVGRVVYVSSGSVYGEETDNPAIREETPVDPQSYYGIAKYASECLLRKTAAEHGISLVCVRLPLVYGPGDDSRSYGPSGFIHAAKSGGGITLWGDGTEKRAFVFVDDVGRLLARLAFSDVQGVLNGASGKSNSFQDVLHCLRNHFPDLRIEQRPRTKRQVNQEYDASRFRRLFPDFAFTPLDRGLANSVSNAG